MASWQCPTPRRKHAHRDPSREWHAPRRVTKGHVSVWHLVSLCHVPRVGSSDCVAWDLPPGRGHCLLQILFEPHGECRLGVEPPDRRACFTAGTDEGSSGSSPLALANICSSVSSQTCHGQMTQSCEVLIRETHLPRCVPILHTLQLRLVLEHIYTDVFPDPELPSDPSGNTFTQMCVFIV